MGYAETDPLTAWNVFLTDMSDPKMKYLLSPSVTPTEIFKNYATHSPEKCWSLILSTCSNEYHGNMLAGYTSGAHVGENWEQKYHEFSQALKARDIESDYNTYQYIAERWATENPTLALSWYAKMAPLNGFNTNNSVQNLFNSQLWKPIIHSSTPTSAVVELLDGMNTSHRYHSKKVVSIIEQLIETEQTNWAVSSMQEIIGDTFSPWDIPLIKLIPTLKDQSIREALFLQAAKAVPSRRVDTFATMNFKHPNICYDTINELAETIDLSPEIYAEVKTSLLKIEAEEKKARNVTPL